MKKTEIIDLSHTIEESMPLFPGSKEPFIKEISNHKTDGYLEHYISYNSHTGTHVDAPAHILDKGKPLTHYSIADFIGKGSCIDVSNLDVIDGHFIVKSKHILAQTEFALFYTGKSKSWGTEDYYKDFPVFTEYAAQLLGTFNLKGVAMDSISPDPIDSKDYIAHKTLLKYRILIIENLTALDQLTGKNFTFHAIPLKTNIADGSPVRAFAKLSF